MCSPAFVELDQAVEALVRDLGDAVLRRLSRRLASETGFAVEKHLDWRRAVLGAEDEEHVLGLEAEVDLGAFDRGGAVVGDVPGAVEGELVEVERVGRGRVECRRRRSRTGSTQPSARSEPR